MRKILNYFTTDHFINRMSERAIDPFLISFCLGKGQIVKDGKEKTKFIMKKELLQETILEYFRPEEYSGLESITVITKKNILITVFARYSDSGLNLEN